MRIKLISPPIHLAVLLCVLASTPLFCNGGRLPKMDNVFEMSVDDDSSLLNGDKEEQEMFKKFQEEAFEKFQEEEMEKKNAHKKEEKKKREEKELKKKEEEERLRDEQEKKEREERKERKRLKDEKEEEERKQKEKEEKERKLREKEEEIKAEEQRKHNKQWREQHEGRKKKMTEQEKWRQEQERQAEEARRQFEAEHEEETEKKKIEEAQAAELRVLEPHVETHTKEEKAAIKDREENKEDHREEVVDRLDPAQAEHLGEDPLPEEEKKEEKKEEDKEENKDHEEGEDEDCEGCRIAREAEAKLEAEETELKKKLAAEAEELSVLEPHVQVHSKAEKKVEEMLKDKPFQAGDIEVAVHGGGHVHEETGEHKEVGVQGVEEVLETGKYVDKKKTDIGADDVEHLVHVDHSKGKASEAPGLAMPDDVRDNGGDFARDNSKPKDKAPGKKITMEDIEKLGLSKDMLKGVDLTKLLARDQREYERFQAGDEDYEDDDDDDENPSFWSQMSRIRKDYLDSLAARIRNIGVPDMETAEWEKEGQLDDREMPTIDKTGELREGETPLEHQMESWGNTAVKGKDGTAHHRFAPKIGEIPE